ncbi:hypothetical protein HMPREF3190_00277 [Umbribacter vaginalis]|nr:hypothetical protein HMPREF3190_00277 [Coriobacteriales bacterium DNF00809]
MHPAYTLQSTSVQILQCNYKTQCFCITIYVQAVTHFLQSNRYHVNLYETFT